jgi:hypothetical protein
VLALMPLPHAGPTFTFRMGGWLRLSRPWAAPFFYLPRKYMKSTYPLPEKPKVIRPAAIAIRFTGTDTPDSPFRKALNLYQTVLNTKPVEERKEDCQYYYFPVGSAKDPKKKDG